MSRLFRLFRTTTFLLMLVASLAMTTVGFAAWAVSLTTQVATLTAGAAATAIANRKALAAAVARTKAKARLRRVIAVVPIAGIAAVAAFERQDYLEWKAENPGGDLNDYGCEVAGLSAEVVDEVLQDLPEAVRPSPDLVLSQLPECQPAG